MKSIPDDNHMGAMNRKKKYSKEVGIVVFVNYIQVIALKKALECISHKYHRM